MTRHKAAWHMADWHTKNPSVYQNHIERNLAFLHPRTVRIHTEPPPLTARAQMQVSCAGENVYRRQDFSSILLFATNLQTHPFPSTRSGRRPVCGAELFSSPAGHFFFSVFFCLFPSFPISSLIYPAFSFPILLQNVFL